MTNHNKTMKHGKKKKSLMKPWRINKLPIKKRQLYWQLTSQPQKEKNRCLEYYFQDAEMKKL